MKHGAFQPSLKDGGGGGGYKHPNAYDPITD